MLDSLAAVRRFAGIGANQTGHLEKWISGAGGLAGILGVMLVSQTYLGLNGAASLVASMGASAVLLYAVPHGPLSQPWSVFGGHLVSATVGIACIKLPLPPLATAPLAVALAITAMYYLRCIHPPGGATALTAVASGEAVRTLGFHYVLTPVMLNVMVILSVAILFNLPFPWRRYPAIWARRQHPPADADNDAPENDDDTGEVFTRAALAGAARTLPAALPLDADNLDTLCSVALCRGETGAVLPADIRIGSYYCNGAFGPDWQVRQVVSGIGGTTPEDRDVLAFRVVAGYQRRSTGTASRAALAEWASYEVCRNENSWQRTGNLPPCSTVTGDAA